MLRMLTTLLLVPLNAGIGFPDADQLPVLDDLPDPLTMSDGAPVESPEDWQRRREEITALLLHYQYGHAPPPPDNLRAEVTSSEPVLDGAARLERVTLTMGPDSGVRMQAAVYIPAGEGTKPVLLAVEPVWKTHLLPVARMAVERGYAFAGYERHDLVPDEPGRSAGLYPLYPDHDWAALAVWAWGASRVVDYLHSRDDIDTARIALTGHSRAGKAALLAAALDTRLALVAPHGSGAGGAGSFRLCPKGAETLDLITRPNRFHYWFHPRLRGFAGREDRLPFDQHFLRALVAPRVVISMDGIEDHWANPSGTEHMQEAAQPVFDFLGAPRNNLFHLHPGGHDMTDRDWTALLDYCDRFFFGGSEAAPSAATEGSGDVPVPASP